MTPTAVDDTLAREASGGDERAFAKIFRTYHQPLFRYCLSILGNSQDAEDALQETMVKVLRALPGEKREIALKPWLYRIAHNESIDLLRRRRENVSFEDNDSAPAALLAEHVETRQRLRQLIADLGLLPERQRGALLMREAAGLEFDEIGAALETTPAVARQTLYEARLGLREMQAGRDMDCAAVTKALSDGDRRGLRRRDLRAHLRGCKDCRGFAEEMDARRNDLGALSPLPTVAAAALLHGVVGGGTGIGAGAAAGGTGATGTSSGLGGLIGGGAAKSVGTATLLKGAATFAVVAAIGVGAADKGGLIHFGHHRAAATPRSHGGADGKARASEAAAPTLGVARKSVPNRLDSGGPSPIHGSAGAKRHRSVGPARAASPASPEDRAVENTELAPREPSAGQSIDAPAPSKSGVAPPTGHDHVESTGVVHGREASSAEAEPEAAKPPATTHPVHPTHPIHPAKPEKPEKLAKPPKAEKPPKVEEPAETEEPEGDAPAEGEAPAPEVPGKKPK